MRREILACVVSILILGAASNGVIATGPSSASNVGAMDSQMNAATVSFANQTSGGTTVVVQNVTLSDGGFVAIHDTRLMHGEPFASVIGVSSYLSPGTHHNVTVRLYSPIHNSTRLIAMPHKDTNGDRGYQFVASNGNIDSPYTSGGKPVTDPARVHASATVQFGNQRSDGASVVVNRVELASGGFVVVHNDSLMQGRAKRSAVGHSRYLSAGIHRNVTLPLSYPISENQTLIAMPHRDTNGNQQFDWLTESADTPFTSGGSPVVQPAHITVSNQSTVSFAPQSTGGTHVVVGSAFLPKGGFVVIHNSSLMQGHAKGSVVGHSQYLAPGLHRNIPVTLDHPINESQTLIAMTHMDTNGNQQFDWLSESADGPYTQGGAPVTDAANTTVSASLSFPAQRSDGRQVVVPVVDLSNGGFVVIHSSQLAAGDPVKSVVGHSGYLSPGVHRNVSITLSRPTNETQTLTAMAHKDTNGNQQYDFGMGGGADTPYTVNGHPVVDAAPVTVTATVGFTDQTTNGKTVVVRSVTLMHGGFVAIHNTSLKQGHPFTSVIGSSQYLKAGTHRNVTIQLDRPITTNQTLIAMPHYDTNGNHQYDFASSHGKADSPYLGASGPVVNPAAIGVQNSQMTTPTTSGTTTSSMSTTTTTSMASSSSTPSGSTTSSSSPGFTVAVSLIALVLASLFVLRRRRR